MADTYVPLARKWRPRSFADVVGQEEIVRALTNSLTQERLAHAYLFSGPRGVGKTTSARLLAAAINCHAHERPDPYPCGSCASCTEVLEGRSIDAMEIDGATHGKVDQARDLIEVVSYAPVRDRRKVFIIDEVHAISTAAFQALLKTLEEPPSHAVFILATTERHKIPATIVSRCQRFDFRRLTDAEVALRLADIAVREGWGIGGEATAVAGSPRVDRDALATLAAAATGSLRDGLSLLDQAVAQSGGHVSVASVEKLLGAPDRSALVALLSAVLSGERADVLSHCARLEAAGADARASLHDLTSLVRGAVRQAADPNSPSPQGLSDEAVAQVRDFARSIPYETLLRALSMMAESDGTLRRSDAPGLAFEILLLRLAELPRLVPLEEFLSGRRSLPVLAPGPGPGTLPSVDPVPRASASGAERPRFVGLTPLAIEPDAERGTDPAAAFRAALEKRSGALGASLDEASIQVSGRDVTIAVDPPNPSLERRLGEPGVRKLLEEAALSALGRGAKVSLVAAMPAGGDLSVAAASADPRTLEQQHLRKKAESDEKLQKALELFGGRLAEVKKDEGEPS